jgi:hypothetical protein
MNHRLDPRGQAYQRMSIAIAEQQNELKEEQTSRPNAGRAAEPRQDLLGDDWLDKKQVHR